MRPFRRFIQRDHEQIWRCLANSLMNLLLIRDLADDLDSRFLSQGGKYQLAHELWLVGHQNTNRPVHVVTPLSPKDLRMCEKRKAQRRMVVAANLILGLGIRATRPRMDGEH